MKRIFTLLTISLLVVFESFAQEYVNYDRDTRWFIGINAGATWTSQTEVPYQFRGGYGFTFGRSYGMERDKIFSWDLRARFLHAQVQGQATDRYTLNSTTSLGLSHYGPNLTTYQDSLGYFIPNYRTNILRGSAELVLNTNRLRQRTGWNLSVFGGIGITGYHTAADLVNDDIFLNDPIYDYDELNSTTVSALKNFQDGEYETDLVGDAFDWEVDWMPSFGFGISKQIHPAVSIGLEHKMTWTRTNLFDGMPNNSNGTASTLNDRYHYTSLGFKFHLFNGKRTEVTDNTDIDDFDNNNDPDIDDFDNTDPVVDPPVTRKKPIVDIYDPNTSPHTTTNNTFRLKANIYYVDSRSDVTFKQDGNINTNFTFNPSTNQFESNVVLHPGQNLFEITGVNEAGMDYESVIIIYEKEEEPINPPIVTITNPPYTPYHTNSSVFGLVSTVLNVESKSQIHVYFNGINLNAFSYNLSSKVLNASLNLIEGTNTVTVTATNEAGSDSKTVQIIYKKPVTEQPPIVDFVYPGVDPYYSNVSAINVQATALHVAKKSDLTVKINGNPTNSFSFNTTTKEILFHTNLIEGANILEIIGVNNAGMDIATTTIIYTRPETPQPPIVTFIDPDYSPITVYESSYNVTAKVEHVASAGDITLKINGVISGLFTYSTSSDLMNFTTSLVEGSNVIEIKGVNEYGVDIKSTTIIYKRPIPQAPPIVNITYPAVDNMEFESPEITLEASVLNVAGPADIDVLVNGIPTTGFTYNLYTKILYLPMVLEEGSNIVQITGTNASGSDTDTRIIKYKKPVVPCPPTVNFINPPSTPHLVSVAPFTVTANTTHIDSKTQIVFKHNGELIANAAYSFTAGHQIIYDAILIPGSNIFEAIVTNADGSASDLVVINYEADDEPCIIPTVGYISPVPYSTVDNPNVTIDAQINNHSPGTTVELKLDGVSKGYMTYNAATSIASKPLTLNEGSNAITVVVTNECGTNQATFTLNYEAPDAPCPKPTLVAGGSTSFTTLEETVTLTLTATHVDDASDLKVKHNGSDVPFSYDAGTGTITISGLGLSIGTNSVVVTAKTNCDIALLVYNITREVCELPVISGVSPVTGTSIESESVVVTANITNVNADEIVLIVNGVSEVFTYNEATNALSEAVHLNVGANTIVITATNACGSDSETITVVRETPCTSIVTNLLTPATSTVTATEETYDVTLHTTGLTSVEQINVTFNGASVTPTFDPISGNVMLTGLSLNEGANTVTINMENECSSSTVSYTINYEGCAAPIVVINGVAPGLVVTDGVFELFVIVSNVSGAEDITLKFNGEEIDFDYNPATHLLQATLPLLEGDNGIEVIANGCEITTESSSLTYDVPCEEITYSLVSPTVTPVTAVEDSYTITLTALGIDGPEHVTVLLDGTAIPFTYSAETNLLTIADIPLSDGTNTILVSMTNDCSSQIVSYAINYDGCEPPVITLGANPTAVTEAAYDFEANVSNISNPANITVLLNDAPIAFVFDPSTGALEADLTLAVGDNTIRIVANGCETANTDFAVNYTVPCEPITYALSHPTSLAVEVAEATYSISLVVEHAETISVTNNGTIIPHTYSGNVLSINAIALASGANTIVVSLSNACSSESITYSVTHNDCSTPEINLGGNALSSESASYTFAAIVTNIESAEQIQLEVNGAPAAFSFDASTGAITAVLTLSEGANDIVLRASGCESAEGSIRVAYSIPCSPVTYSLASPATLVSSTEEDTISLSINTSNVSDPATVAATLNGATIPHNFTGGVITINNIVLDEGTNVVTVSFGNECSSETVTYTIEHEPCYVPSIVVNGLTDGMVLVAEDLVFYSTISNVDDAGDIIVKFNGVSVPFVYSTASDLLEVPLVLNEGSNNIEIIVNGCELVTGSVEVIYDPPCVSPTYSFLTPSGTDVTVEGGPGTVYTVSLNVHHVTSEQITVLLDGTAIPFTLTDGTLLIDVTAGAATEAGVIVNLENECGTVSVSYAITFEPEEEEEPACMSHVSATFSADNKSVTANSDKDLSNVVLKFEDGTTQKFEGLSGHTATFAATGSFTGKCIVGVWIKSGCNLSGDGPGYGAWVANTGWIGICEVKAICNPLTYSLVTPARLNVSTTVSPYIVVINTTNIADISGVNVTVNGTKVTPAFAKGRITLSGIKLIRGANSIRFTLSNPCSSETVNYVVTYNPPANNINNQVGGGTGKVDGRFENPNNGGGAGTINQTKVAPVITPINPSKPNVTVKSQTFSFRTKVSNVSGKGEIQLMVNGRSFPGFNYSTGSKQLSAVLRLNPGVNVITVRANNGVQKEQIYRITYDKPAVQQGTVGGNTGGAQNVLSPRFEFVSPSSKTYTSPSQTFAFKVKALNVRSKSDITLTVNGSRVTNFSFSSSSKTITAVLRLKSGNNTVKVDAKNGAKTATISYNITYKPKQNTGQVNNTGGTGTGAVQAVVKRPEFKFVSPTSTTKTVKNKTFVLKTKVLNVAGKSNITLTVNGVKVNGFTYSTSTKELIATLQLKTGTNTIQIVANNQGKKASITYNIKYVAAVNGTVKPGGTGTGGVIQGGGTNNGVNRRVN